MRRIRHALSIAVFSVWVFTTYGSQMPSLYMSAEAPVVPFTPQDAPALPSEVCFVRSSVRRRITLAPQFCSGHGKYYRRKALRTVEVYEITGSLVDNTCTDSSGGQLCVGIAVADVTHTVASSY
jgi:hypothetical protein